MALARPRNSFGFMPGGVLTGLCVVLWWGLSVGLKLDSVVDGKRHTPSQEIALHKESVDLHAALGLRATTSSSNGVNSALQGLLQAPEAIVVMGQLLKEDGSATQVLKRRIEKAASVFKERGHQYPVVVSGGDPHGRGVTEAEVMKAKLEAKDVPSDLIMTEDRSANTVQNALYVLDMVGKGCKTLHLVTSDFHMPRCAYIYEAVLKSKDRADIKLIRHPVSGGCPSASTSGEDKSDGSFQTVNDMTLLQRLHLEQKFLSNEEHYLKKDSPEGSQVAPLPKDRLKLAQDEVAKMIEEEERRQAK